MRRALFAPLSLALALAALDVEAAPISVTKGPPTKLSVGAGPTPTPLAVRPVADATISGTTTADGTSWTITGTGTRFTTELAVGDRIALSSAPATFFNVAAIASDTQLTVIGANATIGPGNGTTQTILVSRASLRVEDPSGTAKMLVTGNGLVGIGISRPASSLHANGSASVDGYGTSASVVLRRAQGTQTAPTAVTADQLIADIKAQGHTGTIFAGVPTPAIEFRAAESFTPTATGSYLSLKTTPTGSTSVTERLRINADGSSKFFGDVVLQPSTSKPTCSSSSRGSLRFTNGATGAKDALEICAKDAGDAYAWRTLY